MVAMRFNLLSKDLRASVNFYRTLFGLTLVAETDWYVVLSPGAGGGVELGLIDEMSEFAPRHAWGMHQGSYIGFAVPDLFTTLAEARTLGAEIITEPVPLDYGETRALVRDPSGMVVAITTPTTDLLALDRVVVEPADRTVAIDQAQPEDRDHPRPFPA